MQKYVKFSAMPSLQVQAGRCSDHHRHRHCHHHRHRGEPALSQSPAISNFPPLALSKRAIQFLPNVAMQSRLQK